MALSAILSNVVFGILYIVVLRDGRELYWDRGLVLAFVVVVYVLGYSSKIAAATYASLVSFLFYVVTTLCIWTVAYNQFDGFYFLSLFITTQACAYSFRDEHSTFWFVLYLCLATLAGLFFISEIDFHRTGLYAVIIVLMSVLQYLASKVKCKFMREMKMNQDLLRLLITKSEDAVFLTDMNGNIFDLNPRVTELFGFQREDLLNRDFKVLRKHSLSGVEIESGLSELETNKFWSMETILTRKNKTEVPVRISITLIKNAQKKYLVYRVMDITINKAHEAEILEARDRAEAAVKSKGKFLAVMSHEIRTPLNGVIATTSLMEQTDMSSEQMEFARTIKKSGQSLLMLINDILEFSKMESGKMLLDPHPCQIDELILDVVNLIRPHATAKGIDLNVSVDSNIPAHMMLDGHRLKQILINLVGNAVKFTSKGKVEIICEVDQMMYEDVTLKFSVKDSGIGIPEDKMHMLFQSFTQVDSSISRKFGGTGLGLAISRQLVELMGGKIAVSSVENDGTTFTFTILAQAIQGYRVIEKTEAEAYPIMVDCSKLKVLVAEDNEINQQVLRFIMQSINMSADFVVDGRQAVDACKVKNYDLIFMDMQMPEMDGIAATKELRSNMVHQPYIIAITANSFEEDKRLCLEVGMNDFLAKPFEVSQLKAAIGKWQVSSGRDMDSAA